MKKLQFSLRSVLLAIAVTCVLLALLFSQNPLIRIIATCVIVANGLGLLAGLLVTHVLGLPRAGSYSYSDEDETN